MQRFAMGLMKPFAVSYRIIRKERESPLTQKQGEVIAWLNRAFFEEMKLEAFRDYKQRKAEYAEQIGNGTDTKAIEKTIAEEKCLEQERIVAACREEIEQAIEQIQDPVLEAVLIRRYLNFEQLDEIAAHMHYSVRAVSYKLQQAREKIADFCR